MGTATEAPAFELPFEAVRGLLLDLAQERSLEALLGLVVQRLGEHADVALARIWLVREGDICPTCPMRDECPGGVPCLQLVASAGRPLGAVRPGVHERLQADRVAGRRGGAQAAGEPELPADAGGRAGPAAAWAGEPPADWSGLDGAFRRFPIGKRKVGRVAATTEAVCVEDARLDARWIARPDWVAAEGIRGFGGQPLLHHGGVLGVLGVFTRSRFCPAAMGSLRILADHAAAAIANARAFEENARLRRQLEAENEYLRAKVSEARAFGEIQGSSEEIARVAEQIGQVAPTDATVLIQGESGTGKELVAREIHRRSARGERPMIRVNCASVPKELFESEFFGHVKGAFTGAVKDRAGRFAAADGGTLFLDEVGEIPLELQSKLLRVLQEGQYERVGDERTRAADVRIIAASNRNLATEVKAGRFRQDLFYRLHVFPIEVPPLHRRREDIALLAEHFLARAVHKLGRNAVLSDANIAQLCAYDWPGNVRELQNALERAVITARNGRLHFDLPDRRDHGRSDGLVRERASRTPEGVGDAPAGTAGGVLTDEAIRALERRNLVAALEQAQGRVYGPGGAAELLGLKPTTVASRIARLGIARPKGG